MPQRKRKRQRVDPSGKGVTKPLSTTNRNEPLPLGEGPKLTAFDLNDNTIEYVRLLSAEESSGHSHVFEVTIGARSYALKIFKFYDSAEDAQGLAGRGVPLHLVIKHLDPFYAECRAYGRIEEKGKNGKAAVRCYGYLHVAAAQETVLNETFDVSDWDRPDEEYDQAVSERQPFRAIVKELVTDTSSFREKMVARMLGDLRSLRKIGIYVQDIREDNYRGGKLVDFSVSWTIPHIMLSDKLRNGSFIERDIENELKSFDTMVKNANIATPFRATPNQEYLEKLRPRKKG